MKDMFHDFDDDLEMVDPYVGVHLTNGNTLVVQHVSIIDMGKRLNEYGFIFLSSGDGEYSVIFRHGVAALTVLHDSPV